MKLLRNLISLEIQESKNESVHAKTINNRTPTDTSSSYQSAKNLIDHKHLQQHNKPSQLFAYSSLQLSKHKNDFDINNNNSVEIEYEFDRDEEYSDICLDLSTEINQFNLTLPSDFDLDKLECTNNDDAISLTSLSCLTSNSSDLTFNNIDEIDNSINDIQIGLFPKNDFKFMYNISHGAFGIVHKEFHLPTCQIVAIKHYRSNNIESINSLKKEIKIYNEFKNNKYIINMIEYGLIQNENKLCIAMEYMNMSSLNKNKYLFINNTINKIKYTCFCILNGLKYLHNKLFVHNDIKPANILINDNGNIKLTDFGCTKQMKNINIPLTKPIGTQYYQSYEKKFIIPIKYTIKTDIYSFGITICELLLPKKQSNKNIITPFQIPTEIMEKYSSNNNDLIDFLNKCLDQNYEQRWNAKQLLNHSFLKNVSNDIKDYNINQIEDMDDLEFMTNTLIDYYTNYQYKIDSNIDKNINVCVHTPIDYSETDYQRIKNISKSSGFSVDFVQDFISKRVTNVKNKTLKM